MARSSFMVPQNTNPHHTTQERTRIVSFSEKMHQSLLTMYWREKSAPKNKIDKPLTRRISKAINYLIERMRRV